MPKHTHHIIFLSLLLSACGGDSGNSPDNGTPLPTIATYEGNWLMNSCVPTAGVNSVRSLIVVTLTGESSISFQQGALQYGGTACQGTGSLAGALAPLGSVTFSTTEGNSSISFNRGLWTPTVGSSSRTIWALETRNRLCLVGDQNPTLFPSVQHVANHLAMMPDSGCYARQ